MLSVTESGRRSSAVAPDRKPYARIPEVLPIPNLIELQLNSFNWFLDNGLRELFDEISPIQDFTGRVMELRFKEYEFEAPKYSELECRTRDLTFSKPLYVWVELLIKETGEIQRQRVYMGDFPFMTEEVSNRGRGSRTRERHVRGGPAPRLEKDARKAHRDRKAETGLRNRFGRVHGQRIAERVREDC
jgi:DNA-directed RNA polymerase beta subunit